MRDFWKAIDASLDTIETDKSDTFDKVRDALNTPEAREYGAVTWSKDSAFFGGSGGDRSLMLALVAAGWRVIWSESSYFYVARHTVTGETLTYIEGDVQRGITNGIAVNS